MRCFTVEERRTRLARRHHLAEPIDQPLAGVVTSFVGLHATDPATPYLTLWARCDGFRVADLDAAQYDDRALVKHLAVRRTLWVFNADVVKAGIAADGEEWLEEASTAVLAHLDEHGLATARELRAALPQLAGTYDAAPGKPWGGEGPISPRVLVVLGVAGQMVRGPNEGGWTTSRPKWTSTVQWLGASDPMEHDAARAALIRMWLRTLGPATVNDVKWYFGHTLTWARDGLRDIGAVEVDMHGTPGYARPARRS